MSLLELSGTNILHYPDIVAFLQQHSIAIRDVRYVAVETQEMFHRSEISALRGVTRKQVTATVVLYDSQQIPLPLDRLIYNAQIEEGKE